MLIPYRAKNPIKHFPIATVSIIALNIIVYLFTTEHFLVIRESIIKAYGWEFGVTPIYTYITSLFLHAEPLHLLGNMLFLWVFGPSVEDRLGIPKYLGLYFLTGISGALLQGILMVMVGGKNLPSIGASGCIMGVVGAYWYMFSWSPISCCYWVTWFYRGLADIKAFWVIGFYVLLNLFDGFLDAASGMNGGVGNFAHLGGIATGVLLCMAFRAKRDSSEMSEARAMHSESKDLYNVPVHALETMAEAEPDNPELLRALVTKAVKLGDMGVVSNAFVKAGPAFIDKDPALVAHYVVDLKGDANIYRSIHLLRLAGMLERQGDPNRAMQLYTFIAQGRPNDPEAETALYRMATAAWNVYRDAGRAKEFIAELQRRYPYGDMNPHCHMLLKKIGQS